MAYDVDAPRVVRLNLDGTVFDGVHVVARIPTVGQVLGAGTSNSEVYDLFCDHLESWDLTRSGEPVPPTREEFDRLDHQLGKSMAFGWVDAVTRRVEPRRPLSANAEALLEKMAEVMDTPTPAANGTAPPPGVEIEAGL